MKIAIPVDDQTLCQHFGHCRSFAIVDTGEGGGAVARNDVPAPPHEPGLLPIWLADRGVNVVIAGGMGSRARTLLEQKGIKVVIGAPVDTPENLARAYAAGRLVPGANPCDH
ncbi:MAG: ATPase [Alphaproteobacteria bacterium]|nr:ATPase [Alphaproteobacteria bacterium]